MGYAVESSINSSLAKLSLALFYFLELIPVWRPFIQVFISYENHSRPRWLSDIILL